jgi:hypothetical protein
MLEDGTYGLVLKPEQGISEDQVNIVEDFTEAPNQSSEVINIPNPSPTQEGKLRCITQLFKLCIVLCYISILCITFYEL